MMKKGLIRSEEGLTLETSAFRIPVRWSIYIINSIDKTNFFRLRQCPRLNSFRMSGVYDEYILKTTLESPFILKNHKKNDQGKCLDLPHTGHGPDRYIKATTTVSPLSIVALGGVWWTVNGDLLHHYKLFVTFSSNVSCYNLLQRVLTNSTLLPIIYSLWLLYHPSPLYLLQQLFL